IMMADDDRTVTVLQGRGTAAYTPLEQYGGDSGHTDGRSDIYSFAATLYHLLTGQLPTDAKERFLHPGKLPRPRELNSTLSSQSEEGLLWALETHPDARPATIEEFLQGLAQGVSDDGGRPRPTPSWESALATHRQLLPIAFFLLLLALFLTWQLSQLPPV
ncbi:MAG: serine/threonine protein kinase, partial [Ardenticatenales bacterium]|nr:serine/threonine protein kinase [Ardenticatenales bacterium]